MNPYNSLPDYLHKLDTLDNTMSRALTDAERASIACARQSFERGEIHQREIAPNSGIYTLERK